MTLIDWAPSVHRACRDVAKRIEEHILPNVQVIPFLHLNCALVPMNLAKVILSIFVEYNRIFRYLLGERSQGFNAQLF